MKRPFTAPLMGLLILTASAWAQELPPGSGFSGFGRLPVETPDSLLRQWDLAETPSARFDAGKGLIRFHEAAGTSDSVIFYASQLRDEATVGAGRENLPHRAFISYSLAKAYQEKGLYDEALRYYLSGIAAGDELKDPSIVNRNKFGQAGVYFLRNEYEKSRPLYEALLNQAKDEELLQQINKQLGIIHLSRKETAEAETYFRKALTYFQQSGHLKDQLEVRLNLGIIAETRDQADSAYALYQDVKDQAMEHQFFDLYIRSGQRIGDMLLAEKDYENAGILLSMVYLNAMQWEDLQAQQKALNSLQQLHAATGDYKNAYALMSQYRRVSGEILQQQNRREVNELEIKYETAQKEKELLLKESQLRQQKTVKTGLFIGFLVVLIPIIGLLYMYYQKLQAQNRLNASMEEASQQKITAMLKEKELELLAASMEGGERERKRLAQELHDSIGGNLAAIKMQLSGIVNSAGREVISQLDDTCRQVRDLSHDLVAQKFNNTGFTELIETYLRGFTAHGGMDVSFHAWPGEEVNALPTAIKVELYKIIQELMTNAHKHAGASKVEVQLTRVDNALKLIIEDNGKGFLVDHTPTGIGFQNIEERLKAFGGKLNIDSFPQRGTVADIDIPLKPAGNEA